MSSAVSGCTLLLQVENSNCGPIAQLVLFEKRSWFRERRRHVLFGGRHVCWYSRFRGPVCKVKIEVVVERVEKIIITSG